MSVKKAAKGRKTREKVEKKETHGITAKKSKEFPEWYNEVVLKTGLAGFSPISGCMVIKPYGYAIWEKIVEVFDRRFKETGHRNAYFPLFIPEKLLTKEAEHFEGFVPEVAWVEDNGERFALRPTSETIIHDTYSKWIRSWRDLPLLINQWCNVVRWETKVTKIFLRTREFLWQEGHTAHATLKEADEEVMKMLDIYVKTAEDHLAVPVISGKKSESEKFAGALHTTALEALMPDGKALQMGTSHNLGQNFSRPFKIRFLDKDGKKKYVWQTSWGVSTRLIGSIVMVHGDDKGLVLPPRLAPIQVVIIPIIFDENKKTVLSECRKVEERLKEKFSVKLDDSDSYSAGWKFNEYEMLGVPVRLEIGPKDVKKKQAMLVRRDTGEKAAVRLSGLEDTVEKTLGSIQKNLLKRAASFLKKNTVDVNDYEKFKKAIDDKKMAKAFWCESPGCEEKIKDDTAATIRVIPFDQKKASKKCVSCGKKAKLAAYFARSY